MSVWKKAYEDLKAFIANNPGIELGPSIISIPSDVRGEFYRLFDAVRLSIINEYFPVLLEKGSLLSKEWKAASGKAIERYKLQEIVTDPATNWFLQDPSDGAIRLLFDSLFDMIRGKQDIETFEQTAPKIVADGLRQLMCDGYQSWTTLSLLELASTDKIYTVKKSELDEDPSNFGDMTFAGIKENIPEVEEPRTISFKHTQKHSFLVPGVIGHSQVLDLFISIVPFLEYSEANWRGRNLDLQRRWIGISDITNEFGKSQLWPNLAIYLSDHWRNLVVAADNSRVGQPDIIIELKVDKDWYEKEGLDLVRRHYNVLKPKWGSFVVCLDDVPEAAVKELESEPEFKKITETAVLTDAAPVPPETSPEPAAKAPEIYLLGVGFDARKLQPIVESIAQSQAAGVEPLTGIIRP